jgi:hypothetical protein
VLPQEHRSQFQSQHIFTYNNINNNNNQPVCEHDDALLQNQGVDVGIPADRIVTPKGGRQKTKIREFMYRNATNVECEI